MNVPTRLSKDALLGACVVVFCGLATYVYTIDKVATANTYAKADRALIEERIKKVENKLQTRLDGLSFKLDTKVEAIGNEVATLRTDTQVTLSILETNTQILTELRADLKEINKKL